MSIHRVDVVRIGEIEKHPNADSLGLVKIGGFTCIVRLAEWKPGDLAAYIQPDSVVDSTRPEFAFLAGHERIRVRRLRGIYSQGLLIRAPEGTHEGDDVAELLNVTHYEPPLPEGRTVAAPAGVFAPKYDVENINRFLAAFQPGEPVVATEKVHGANARFTCVEGELCVGSRGEWLADQPGSLWWLGIRNHPEIVEFLKAHPGWVAYGEAYGRVQELRYGLANDVRVVLFDLLRGDEWLGWDEARKLAAEWTLPWVPVLFEGSYDEVALRELAEGESLIPGAAHLREGIVVRPRTERTDPELGRVQLKFISNRYLEKS